MPQLDFIVYWNELNCILVIFSILYFILSSFFIPLITIITFINKRYYNILDWQGILSFLYLKEIFIFENYIILLEDIYNLNLNPILSIWFKNILPFFLIVSDNISLSNKSLYKFFKSYNYYNWNKLVKIYNYFLLDKI